MFRTIVTVSAEDAAASRFTPRMQAYWVRTLAARYANWDGTCVLAPNSWNKANDGDCASVFAVPTMAGAKGRNSGKERT